MELSLDRAIRFAGFVLEPAKRRLCGPDGAVIALSARAYDVLVYLIQHRDRIVGKDELIKAVWPDTIVEENNLNQAISAVRRALGDARDAPRFIVTVAGRGYRFIGDIEHAAVKAAEPAAASQEAAVEGQGESGSESASATRPPDTGVPGGASDAAGKPLPVPVLASPSSAASRGRRALIAGAALAAVALGGGLWWQQERKRSRLPKSIAVLPFKPLLKEAANPALALVLTDLLIIRLSRVPGIVVSPLSSVMRFGSPDSDPVEAGRALGVDAVIDGHLYVQDDRVRITARVLTIADGATLWANTFTERLVELLAVQDSLSIQIADAIASELSPLARSSVTSHETADVEAWQLYANGRYQFEQRDAASLRRAIDFFEAALRRDPRFARASVGLSDAYALTAVFGIEPPGKAFGAARSAAARALEIDPNMGGAHAALGHVSTQFDLDLAAGRKQYAEALRLQPDLAFAMGLMALNLIQAGDLAGAADYIRKARTREPAVLGHLALSGWVTYFTRAFDDAEKQLQQLVDAAPGAVLPRQFLGHVLLAKREGARVLKLLDGRNGPAPTAFSNLGRALAQTGDVAAARVEVARLEELGQRGFGVAYSLTLIHLDLGDRGRALDAIERGFDDHSQLQGYLNVEPALDPLRDEPRFRAVARRLARG